MSTAAQKARDIGTIDMGTIQTMRYFVLCQSDQEGVRPHIVAEVVRALSDGEDREITLAGALAGERAVVITRAELEASAAGRDALAAWERGDDRQYDDDADAIIRGSDERSPRLRIIAAVGGSGPARKTGAAAKRHLRPLPPTEY